MTNHKPNYLWRHLRSRLQYISSNVGANYKLRFLIFICTFTFFCTANIFAAQKNPHFEDYPASKKFAGDVTNVIISTRQDKLYETKLKSILHTKPNFAGHYRWLSFGCGANCIISAVVDAKTGTVSWLPFTVSSFPIDAEEPIKYRLESSLIKIEGHRNESLKHYGTYFYNFRRGHFYLIKEIQSLKNPDDYMNSM